MAQGTVHISTYNLSSFPTITMTISEKQTVPDKAKQVVSDAEDDAPLASTHTPNRPEEESPGLFEDFLARSQLAPTLPFQRPKLPRTRSKSGDSPFTLKDRLLPASPPPAPRRSSFQTFAIKPVLSSSPDGGISSSLPKPNMMTTMNMASRLAGSRVKDQTIHHSLSDRSSTHAKPTPAQDSKSRSGGFSADGMKRISNGFGKEWSENKIAPCVSTITASSITVTPFVHSVILKRLSRASCRSRYRT